MNQFINQVTNPHTQPSTQYNINNNQQQNMHNNNINNNNQSNGQYGYPNPNLRVMNHSPSDSNRSPNHKVKNAKNDIDYIQLQIDNLEQENY